MNNAKAKDRILAEIKAGAHHREIEGLRKVLPELESEGLVRVWWDMQHSPIKVKLSDEGKLFVKAGGYTALRNQYIKAKMRKLALWLLAILITALVEETVRVKLIPILFH